MITMKIAIYIFGLLITIANVECNSTRDAVNFCYQKTKAADDACSTENKCTVDDLNDWVFLYNGTKKLQDLSWENRRFTCFHACMMGQRGETTRGKINLEKYIENLAMDYQLNIDEESRLHINECGLRANALDDECSVAAVMGECVTEKWELIDKGVHNK